MKRCFSVFGLAIISCVSFFFFSLPVHASTINVSPINTLTNGLVGYWPMDVRDFTSSNVFLDRSSSGNTETLQGGYTVSNSATIGKISQALSFNGTATYALHSGVPTNMNFQDNTPFTMAAWIKTAATGANTIIATWNFQTTGGWQFSTDPSHLAFIMVDANGTAYRYAISTKTVNDGKWHFVVATYDGSGAAANIHFYIDGVLDTTSVQHDTAPGTLTNNQLYIGRIGGPSPEYWNGSLDDIRVYNRVLSSTEIVNLYKIGQENTQVSPTTYNTNGLVGDWNFDGKNVTGTTVTDSSGNGNTGTSVGSPTRIVGKVGQALSFDGSSQYVSLSSTSTLNQGNHAYTISTWVKPTSLSACNTDGCGLIRSIGNSGSGQQGDFFISLTSTGIVQFANWQASGSQQTKYGTTSTIPTGKWSHIVAEWDGSASKIYINGVSQALNVPPGFTGTGFGNGASIGTILGTVGSGWMLNGAMDNTRVYNRALSDTEIKQLYTAGQVSTQVSLPTYNASGLVGYWPFDGKYTSTTTTQDLSGNGNTGTLTNLPTPTIGKIGQALKFNGTSSYVITSNFNLPTPEVATISAWIDTVSLATTQLIVSKDYTPTQYNSQMLFSLNTDGTLGFRDYSDSGGFGFQANSTGTVSAGKWHFVVFVRNGTSGTFYIDGVPAGTITAGNDVPFANGPVVIGEDNRSTTSYFNGSIDDVRIYNRALSATEVNQLYLMGK